MSKCMSNHTLQREEDISPQQFANAFCLFLEIQQLNPQCHPMIKRKSKR